jgi:hypothetical protein
LQGQPCGAVSLDGLNTKEGNIMTYLESADGVMITKQRAFAELTKHGTDPAEYESFLMDIIGYPDTVLDSEGNIISINAQDVLFWLGY